MELSEKIIELLRSTKREGIDGVIGFLCTSDFFKAPASTKYHNCHEGGLAEHSMNVYEVLKAKFDAGYIGMGDIKEDSIIISALLHDICKANYYKEDVRNVKKDGVWTQVPYYTVDDKSPLGHGCKSVIMLQSYIKLKKEEIYAILYHMGFSGHKEDYNNIGKAFREYPLALALHEADLEATYLIEEEK